ncbi:MAG: carboxypeptidase-like regulatory domain-containing protein [Bacteroidales bacterium]
MKSIKNVLMIAMTALIFITAVESSAAESRDKKKNDQQNVLVIKGKVVDKETLAPLVFASVSVKESNVATVTNIDGEFLIKISDPQNYKNLEVSFLGYKNKLIPLSEMRNNGYKNIITLETAPIPIKEIIIKPMMPDEIMQRTVSAIGKNYANVPNLMTAFYRETIRKNRTYVSIGEALVEIFKAPYSNDLRFDGTRIYKGRKNTDIEKVDTVLFKLQGGPVTSLELDMAKNPEAILTYDAMKYYDYKLSGVIEIDGKPHYVIEFQQKPGVEIPLFIGKFYINTSNYALSAAEFGFNLTNKDEAASLFIKKKPLGMEVTPELASYMVKYREQDGKYYFSYSRAEVKFKVNWKRKLFNTTYTTMSEMAVTDRTEEEVIKFAGKEKLRGNDIFIEEVAAFADPDFWGEYNVIEPDQSIESAIRRIARKVKFSDR